MAALPGWPLAVATASPDLPAPHDPEPEEGDRTPLTPPDDAAWGPAQRRLGADEVALQWASWRAQMEDDEAAEDAGADTAGPATGNRSVPDDSRPEAQAGTGDTPDSPGDGDGDDVPRDPYDGVRRALSELRGYLEDAPPVGRVRSSFAAGGARMLRADGPGWSLVARTDDMAFVLLDDEPREVLPVARGPKLPDLLEALDAMAVRPS